MRNTVTSALVGAGLLIAAGPVSGDDIHAPAPSSPSRVSIGYADYRPAKIDVLVGDTVAWHNDSARRHTVTDDAGAYDSGTIPTGSGYTHRFERPGVFPYHCRLHAGIRGQVDAWDLLIERPTVPADAGSPFPLHGRAALPPDTSVAIEADDGSGAGFQPVTTAKVGVDGSFTAVVMPRATASYRAVVGNDSSPPVQLLVLNHEIAISATRGRGSTAISVHVTPADPGGLVVLQLKLRERFGWWPIARVRLGRSSRARFVVRLRRPALARALLTLPDAATPLATSSVVRAGLAGAKRR